MTNRPAALAQPRKAEPDAGGQQQRRAAIKGHGGGVARAAGRAGGRPLGVGRRKAASA